MDAILHHSHHQHLDNIQQYSGSSTAPPPQLQSTPEPQPQVQHEPQPPQPEPHADPTATPSGSTGPTVGSAAAFAAGLGPGVNSGPQSPKATSAFEMLGRPVPPEGTTGTISQDETMKNLISALAGDEKSMATWGGAPNTLRQWLRSLSYWERDNSVPKSKWGAKLLHALDGPARRIADSIPSEEVLTDKGYSAILSALMLRYKPYLEVAGPASIHAFFYTSERARGDSFATFIAAKELQRPTNRRENIGEDSRSSSS